MLRPGTVRGPGAVSRCARSRVKGRRPGVACVRALVRPLLSWFRHHARVLPWRRTREPYAIWISEIMLQQTRVQTVIPYWHRWMRELPDVQSLARARLGTVLKLWEGLGYYTRARNLRQAARIIVEKHRGRFPERFEDLLALPGIGRYTAGAICSIAFHQPTPALDGNGVRVLTRIFGMAGNPREKNTKAELWNLAQELAHAAANPRRDGEGNCSLLNQALMELGAVICAPRRPKCPLCPVRKHCAALRENRTDQIPNLGKRTASTERRFAAFVVESKGRFLVRQRPPGVINARLWEFPNVEVDGRRVEASQLAEGLLGSRPFAIQPLAELQHTITRYRITMEVFRAEFADGAVKAPAPNRWCSPAQLQTLAFPSAHRKILEALRSPSHEQNFKSGTWKLRPLGVGDAGRVAAGCSGDTRR